MPGGAVMALRINTPTECEIRVPAVGLPPNVEVVLQGAKLGSRGQTIESRREGAALVINCPKYSEHGVVYVVGT